MAKISTTRKNMQKTNVAQFVSFYQQLFILLNNYDFFSRSMYISLQCNDQQYTNFYKSFAFLDSPSINWKTIIVGFTIGQYVFETYLDLRQYRVLQLKTAPKSIEKKFHKKHSTNPKSIPVLKHSFQSFSSTFSLLQNLAIFKYDLLPKTWTLAGTIMKSSAAVLPKAMSGVITQSLFCFHHPNLDNFDWITIELLQKLCVRGEIRIQQANNWFVG